MWFWEAPYVSSHVAVWYEFSCPCRRRGSHSICSIVLCALSVLLLLATLGLGAWGLYEGLHATRHLSTQVFKIVDAARLKVSDRMSVLLMPSHCQPLQQEAPLRNRSVFCCNIAIDGRCVEAPTSSSLVVPSCSRQRSMVLF